MKHEIDGEEIVILADTLPRKMIQALWKRGFTGKEGKLCFMLNVNADIEYEIEDNSFDYDYGQISGTHDPGGSIVIETCNCTAYCDDEGDIELDPDTHKKVKLAIEDWLTDEYENGRGSELLYEAYEPPEPDYDEREYETK